MSHRALWDYDFWCELGLGVPPPPGCFKPGCLQFLRGRALRSSALFCALLCSFGLTFALFCEHLRSFALICVFLRTTPFRTTQHPMWTFSQTAPVIYRGMSEKYGNTPPRLSCQLYCTAPPSCIIVFSVPISPEQREILSVLLPFVSLYAWNPLFCIFFEGRPLNFLGVLHPLNVGGMGWQSLEGAGNHRKTFAENRRFLQKTAGNHRLGSVTLGPSALSPAAPGYTGRGEDGGRCDQQSPEQFREPSYLKRW